MCLRPPLMARHSPFRVEISNSCLASGYKISIHSHFYHRSQCRLRLMNYIWKRCWHWLSLWQNEISITRAAVSHRSEGGVWFLLHRWKCVYFGGGAWCRLINFEQIPIFFNDRIVVLSQEIVWNTWQCRVLHIKWNNWIAINQLAKHINMQNRRKT